MADRTFDYRPVPFWAWNGQMTEKKIREHLGKLKEGGFGGAFIHPRPGLTAPYLSEEWISLWRCALDESKKLGLRLYIYDENTYPSGYAGGHVMSRYPDCAARSVRTVIMKNGKALEQYENNTDLPEEMRKPVKVYETERDKEKIRLLRDITDVPPDERYLTDKELVVLIFQMPFSSAWFGGFPNPDLLRPEVTKALLETTYDLYYKYFGEDFGVWIPAVFSDEPGISPGNVNLEDPMVFPYSSWLSYQFYQRYGYSLEDHMAAICLDTDCAEEGIADEKVRYDYYCLLRELWTENFARPIHDWCEEHGIAWTGHFLDEHWPYPWGCASPAVMSMYEWMQYPGVDMLMTHMLKKDGKSPMLLTVKELESAGAQLGKERLLCECFGAGGWDAAIGDFKRIGDWLAVHGVNMFTPHLVLDSIAGARKTGHPQSMDWREPWWEEYQRLNRYFTRLSGLMAEGKRAAEVLLLHPTTTWFLKRPAEAAGNILWDYEKMDDGDPVKTYIQKLQRWTDAGVEFDLGDEFLIEKYGRVENGRFYIGEAGYSVIYIPKEMRHIRSSTKKLLAEAAARGIRIVMEEKSVCYMDGEKQSAPVLGYPLLGSEEFVEFVIEHKLAPVGTKDSGIAVSRKITADGNIRLFFVNSTPEKKRLSTEFSAQTVKEIGLFDDTKRPYPYKRSGDKCSVEIELEPSGSLFLECGKDRDDAELPVRYEESFAEQEIKRLAPSSVRRTGYNVLALDYGNLLLRGQWDRDIYVHAACERIYKMHGFDKDPWDMAVQYRDRIISRNSFPPGSGFLFEYPFAVGEQCGTLLAAVEHPELCEVSCNGRALARCTDRTWIDEEFGIYDIPGDILKEENVLSVSVCPFDVLMELQPAYLLGDFALRPADKGFVIERPRELTLGGLCGQGICFYPGRIEYAFRFVWDGNSECSDLSVGMFEATALTVTVNGQYAGMAGAGAGGRWDITSYLRKGENLITVELSCSLKNLFGPFHTPEPVRNSAWPDAWKMAPVHGQPSGEHYDLIDYGLKEKIVITNKSKHFK